MLHLVYGTNSPLIFASLVRYSLLHFIAASLRLETDGVTLFFVNKVMNIFSHSSPLPPLCTFQVIVSPVLCKFSPKKLTFTRMLPWSVRLPRRNYHTWQFTLFTITTFIFSYSFSLSFWTWLFGKSFHL